MEKLHGQMSTDMKNYMNSEKVKNKIIPHFVFVIVLNTIMAGVYGSYLFPSSNHDTWKVWEERIIERNLYTDSNFDTQFPTLDEKLVFWGKGLCYYSPPAQDGV
jgi:hypothetical protein